MRSAAVLAALIAILVIVPFFVTLNDYIPAVEREFAAIVREPVSIDNLYASALPVPHARIDGITIGKSEEIRIGKVTFTPNPWSLLRSRKVIRSVDVEDVMMSQQALAILASLTEQDSGSGNIHVEKIRLKDATVKLDQSSFGPFDLHVQVSSAAERGELVLKTRDGSLKARVMPDGERFVLDISAQGWTPPIGPAVRFDELRIAGIARGRQVELTDIGGRLYGGTLAGKAVVSWGKGVSLKGNLDLNQIELKQGMMLISPKSRLSGRLDAKPAFSARAESFSQLDDALRIEARFTVHKGVLHGFDLIGAIGSLAGGATQGGDTRFDDLAGHLSAERRTYRFTNLVIAASGLAARGNVSISPSRALSGQLNTHTQAFGKTASIPLTVAGTLDSPLVYPSPSAIAGAAAGTVILGPAGTAAGAKLGEMIEGMLGKSAKR